MRYKIGDKVKIKTWEKLVEEYGVDNFGRITLPKTRFTDNSYNYYGNVLEITSTIGGVYYDDKKCNIGFYEEEIEGYADEHSCDGCAYEKISDSLDPCCSCTDGSKFTPITDTVNHPFNDNIDILKKAIKTYGIHPQVDMAIEEMSELIKALCKERRTELKQGDHSEAISNIIEEIADVIITLQQLVIIFDKGNELPAEIEYKIKRLAQRMEKEKNK